MEETILSKLKDEHREIQMLLLRVERSKDQVRKQEQFDELKKVLIPHMEAEERTFYTHLQNDVPDEDAKEMAGLANYEHQEIRDLLGMLDGEEFNNKTWKEFFSDLQENIRIHIEEEETALFNEAKEDFSKDELVEFKDEFEKAKSHSSYQ